MKIMLVFLNSFLMLMILVMFLLLLVNSIQKRNDLFGQPPINRIIFIIGKIANFSCWMIFVDALIQSLLRHYEISSVPLLISSLTLSISSILIGFSFKGLGDLNKFGLSSNKENLVVKGVYSFSRNPMYLGFYFLNISSIIFYPRAINRAFGIVGILIHHLIVLGEEKYLRKTFGDKWEAYQQKVHRYF